MARRILTGKVKTRRMTADERIAWIGFMANEQRQIKLEQSFSWSNAERRQDLRRRVVNSEPSLARNAQTLAEVEVVRSR